jgi:hypothetical protein
VTHRTNILRGFSRAAINARKTKCKNGHPFEGGNLYVTWNGKRQCRACHNARRRAAVARMAKVKSGEDSPH